MEDAYSDATALIIFCAARVGALLIHELAHALVARALGWEVGGLKLFLWAWMHGRSGCVEVPSISARDAIVVRHSGWIFSFGLALMLFVHGAPRPALLASTWTALDATASDLLDPSHDSDGIFFCGNFGLIILGSLRRHRVYQLLQEMLRVTMVRGAQSAGVVTYEKADGAVRGCRSRVVNGKRTDLSDLLVKRLDAGCGIGCGDRRSTTIDTPQLFQGHTRFATSSISNLAGCHPHQWVPRGLQTYWRFERGVYVGSSASVESFITHNGDLDFFEIGGVK